MKDAVKLACAAFAAPGWTGDMLTDAKSAIEHVNTVANALMMEMAIMRMERAVEMARLEAATEALRAMLEARNASPLSDTGKCICTPSAVRVVHQGGICAECRREG